MRLSGLFISFVIAITMLSIIGGFADLFGGVGFAANVAVTKKQQRAEEILASAGPKAAVDYCEKGADKHETFFGTFWTSCSVSATFVPVGRDSAEPALVVSRVTPGIVSSKPEYRIEKASVSAVAWDHNPAWDLNIAPVLHSIGL